MKNKKEINSTKGDDKGTIDSLIEYLNKSKKQGATHYEMDWSHDPNWSFKWFRTYKILSEEELKESKIKELQSQIDKLKS